MLRGVAQERIEKHAACVPWNSNLLFRTENRVFFFFFFPDSRRRKPCQLYRVAKHWFTKCIVSPKYIASLIHRERSGRLFLCTLGYSGGTTLERTLFLVVHGREFLWDAPRARSQQDIMNTPNQVGSTTTRSANNPPQTVKTALVPPRFFVPLIGHTWAFR